MSLYRRILVPVDGSLISWHGLREAIRLAKDQRAALRLVHIVDETMMLGAVELGVDPTPLLAALGRDSRALLERARRTAARRGIHVETAMRESTAFSAADAILEEANEWCADLIVMGTHGRRGIRRLFLGSNAEQVLRVARPPVLLVHASARHG
jgi:nucleotide-binding universal stress UspA family protein